MILLLQQIDFYLEKSSVKFDHNVFRDSTHKKTNLVEFSWNL